MKLLAILGSPRAGGNTDTLAKCIIDGAQESGIEIETVELRKLKMKSCIGCEKCWENGKPCIFDDDISRLYNIIASSDVLLLATPVYWYGPTTLLKTLLDRFTIFNRPEGRPMIEGKKTIYVIAYEEEGPDAAEPLIKMLKMSFDYLRVKIIDSLIVDGVGPKGAILSRKDVLDKAFLLGKALVEKEQ
jgi:multimeric flavodoxin WrbA